MAGAAKLPKKGHLEWGRSLVLFVIAWLVGLYVYEVAAGQYGQGVGISLGILTLAVNGFARWRAVESVGRASVAFYFWMAVPLILFFGVPCAVKLVTYFRSEEQGPWWHYLGSLLPFILKLGVPVAGLVWVYVVLGRIRRRVDVEAQAEAEPGGDPRVEEPQ